MTVIFEETNDNTQEMTSVKKDMIQKTTMKKPTLMKTIMMKATFKITILMVTTKRTKMKMNLNQMTYDYTPAESII